MRFFGCRLVWGDRVRPIEARTIDFASYSRKLAAPLRKSLRKPKAAASLRTTPRLR
jgi:hypothetical protein